MDHYRQRKYRGAETWARVRAAYEMGESGPSVARRFDVGLANLRKKASDEGWTRTAIAARLERDLEPRRPTAALTPACAPGPATAPAPSPGDDGRDRIVDAPDGTGWHLDPVTGVLTPPIVEMVPSQALEHGLRLATRRLAEGRPAEATALIKAAEALGNLMGERAPTLSHLDRATEGFEAMDVWLGVIEYRAEVLATAALDNGPDTPPEGHEAWFYRWRELYLEATPEDDRRQAVAVRPELADLWDEAGALRPSLRVNAETREAAEALARLTAWYRVHGTIQGYATGIAPKKRAGWRTPEGPASGSGAIGNAKG